MSKKAKWQFLSGRALLNEAASEPSSEGFAVAGLLCELGLLVGSTHALARAASVPQNTFGKWLQLARREKNLSLIQVAEKTACDLLELVQIENGVAIAPQPRTVHKLAQLFDVDPKRLAVLSGLMQDRPGGPLTQAAVRFAAMSEPSAKLSHQELSALHEFVRYLESREGQ